MRFLNPEQCVDWCKRHSIALSSAETPELAAHVGMPGIRFGPPERPYALGSFTSTLASWFDAGGETLMWVPTSHHVLELFGLYRRVRQAYGNASRVAEEPGHLFAHDEVEELASFLLLVLLASVDTHVLSDSGARLFISSSSWLEYSSNDLVTLEGRRDELREHDVPLFVARSA